MTEQVLQDGAEKEKEPVKEVVVAGVHNYSREDSYVVPTDPRETGVVQGSEVGIDDALGTLFSVGHCGVLGAERR